jgi:hypothetical protein
MCGLFNDAVSISGYIVQNDGMISKYGIGKDVEGSGCGLIVLSHHLPGGTEENHKIPQSG